MELGLKLKFPKDPTRGSNSAASVNYQSGNTASVDRGPGGGNGSTLVWRTHGQRSLAGCSRWGRKEQDATDCAWAQQTVGANGPPDTMTGTCTSCHPAPFSSACRVWHSLLCFLPLVSLIVLLLSRSVVSDSAAPWTVARQAALSMGFSRQKYWSGLPCPPPGDLPNPGVKARSPALQVILYHLSHQGRPSLITEL